MLDYAGYAFPVEGLGPGKRIAMWVRGCRRHCPGCLTPELWRAGEPVPVEDVAADLYRHLDAADGLSISGGEPFDQPEGVSALIDRLHDRRDIEVLVYTGYQLEDLAALDDAQRALLSRIDILIDGPFLEGESNTRQWRGSDNQRVHLLTPRAQQYAACADAPMPDARPLQVQRLASGNFRLIGIPRRGDMAAYRAAMAARGVIVEQECE